MCVWHAIHMFPCTSSLYAPSLIQHLQLAAHWSTYAFLIEYISWVTLLPWSESSRSCTANRMCKTVSRFPPCAFGCRITLQELNSARRLWLPFRPTPYCCWLVQSWGDPRLQLLTLWLFASPCPARPVHNIFNWDDGKCHSEVTLCIKTLHVVLGVLSGSLSSIAEEHAFFRPMAHLHKDQPRIWFSPNLLLLMQKDVKRERENKYLDLRLVVHPTDDVGEPQQPSYI